MRTIRVSIKLRVDKDFICEAETEVLIDDDGNPYDAGKDAMKVLRQVLSGAADAGVVGASE